MKLITRQDLANDVAERWRKQYQLTDGTWWRIFTGDAKSYFNKLIDLGPNPKPDDVENIISGWTILRCDECNQHVEEVVQLGAEPDYESATASICRKCIRFASELY